MMNHRLTASILLTLLAAPCLWATTAAANAPAHPAGYNDSGVELNRTRQYLERQRIARKIQEGRNTQPVEGAEGPEEAQKGAVHFLLKQVELPESQVLSQEELQKITGAYEGKDATLDDLYALVGKINALYQEKGYLTCRAFLAPQTIRTAGSRSTWWKGRTARWKSPATGAPGRNTLRTGSTSNLARFPPCTD